MNKNEIQDLKLDAVENIEHLYQVALWCEQLVTTLEFYADSKNYHSAVGRSDISIDGGQRARDILKERL